MLKTNSKQARENIRNYIINHFDASNYTDTPPETWPEIARFILNTFENEKYYSLEYIRAKRMSYQDVFIDWCAGLPSVLHTSYYLQSAVDDLAAILEETETEKARYTESAAEKMLSTLIYMELQRGGAKNV